MVEMVVVVVGAATTENERRAQHWISVVAGATAQLEASLKAERLTLYTRRTSAPKQKHTAYQDACSVVQGAQAHPVSERGQSKARASQAKTKKKHSSTRGRLVRWSSARPLVGSSAVSE